MKAGAPASEASTSGPARDEAGRTASALLERDPVSYLFVPGDRSERFDKALATPADCVLIDLEDAVAAGQKNTARTAVQQYLAERSDMSRLAVRINAVGTPWHAEDIALLHRFRGLAVMVPKSEPESLRSVLASLAATGEAASGIGRVLLALVETVAGFVHLRELAALGGLARLVFGSVDFHLDAGMELDEESPAMAAVRLQFVLESRLAGLAPPVDGVCLAVDDPVRIEREAARARAAGFTGKLCIHPRQVPHVNSAMRPREEECAWARRVLDAFARSGGAAVRLDGQMIDAPVAERARRLLASCA